MIAAIAGLLVCQLAGEILVRALALPLPGPVAGFLLMFAFLALRGRRDPEGAVPQELGRVGDALLQNLSLLFIPAAVGVVQYLDLLRAHGLAIAVTIVVSTLAVLMVTALTFQSIGRLLEARRGPKSSEPEPHR